jgi:hypothetical protein
MFKNRSHRARIMEVGWNKPRLYIIIRKLISSDSSRIGFDAAWYLQQYPDIAAAGVDPWSHFCQHGYAEGRLPNAACARLWSKGDTSVIPALQCLLKPGRRSFASDFASWTLGRWHARAGQWQQVLAAMRDYMTVASPELPHPLSSKLLWIDALRCSGRISTAVHTLEEWLDVYPDKNDFHLAYANIEYPCMKESTTSEGNATAWLNKLNQVFVSQGLMPLTIKDTQSPVSMDNLRGEQAPANSARTDSCAAVSASGRPLVSIIVPACNAELTLPAALRSLQEQTWEALEILVVDDASTDKTSDIVSALSRSDPRIHLISHPANQGAYIARNTGLSLAKGAYITVHDSDDWSHPQKIEQQAMALESAEQALVSASHWVRCSGNLEFGGWKTPEGWDGWIHRNVSSLMLRRDVFKKLGFWDRVKCSSDTEYYYRIIRAFGLDAIREVLPGTPMSFGRLHPASLTQDAETNIFTVFGGARKQYHDAFHLWHKHARDNADLFMAQEPAERKFQAPSSILP